MDKVACVSVRRWLFLVVVFQRRKDVKYRLLCPAAIFALTCRNIKTDIPQPQPQPQPFSTLEVSPQGEKRTFPVTFQGSGALIRLNAAYKFSSQSDLPSLDMLAPQQALSVVSTASSLDRR
jgi:hypothetical protein